MSEWKLLLANGTRTLHSRELEGLDRIYAYVEYDQWEDEEVPPFYSWSVQDGSCGKVLGEDVTDGAAGLVTAQRAADEAAERLFPGR